MDSNSRTALTESGNATIKAASVQVVGGVSKSGTATLSPAATTGVAVVADPLATLAAPTSGTAQASVNLSGNSTKTINPGIYSQINVSGNARLTLNPGVYILAGGGLTVTGNGSTTGSGGVLYNTQSKFPGTGGTYGGITLSGNGSFNLTAPTSGPYAGVVVFQNRANSRAIALSGNATEGLGGTVYAPAALLYLSGNASLAGPVVVDSLSLTGNAASTQATDNADVSGGDAAGQLLAGTLTVYVDNSTGLFTADELARIQDAVNALDAVVEPFGVSVTETTDSTLANVIVDTGSTTPVGGYADGILGCWNPAGEITMVQGWNWYAGSDATQIGASQFDFQTTMTHELGHAVGLGESSDPTSAMSGTLATGTVIRTLTTADLNIPESETEVDAQRAAPLVRGSGPFSEPVPGGAALPARNDETQAAAFLTVVEQAAADPIAGFLPASSGAGTGDSGPAGRAVIRSDGQGNPMGPRVVSLPLGVSNQASDQLFAEWNLRLPGNRAAVGAEDRPATAVWLPGNPRAALPLGKSASPVEPGTVASEGNAVTVPPSLEGSFPEAWQTGLGEWSLAAFMVAAALAGPPEVLGDKDRDRIFAGLASGKDAKGLNDR